MKQSFQISRCHSEYIQFPTASCEGGLAKTCGRQGAGLKKGWLPCLHEGADLFNPVRRSRNRKAVSPCQSENACSPSEGRVGRNCMRTNGVVCYRRNLLSPLQILILLLNLFQPPIPGLLHRTHRRQSVFLPTRFRCQPVLPVSQRCRRCHYRRMCRTESL